MPAYARPQPDAPGLTRQDVLDIYRDIRSFAAIAKPDTTPSSISLPGVSAPGQFHIVHLNKAIAGGEIRGDGFTANADGTITANRDMFAMSVTCMMIGTWDVNDNVVLGIGIGDPLQIPSQPGVQVGDNYVSRFRFDAVGQGGSRQVTLATPYEPVGKSTTELSQFGVKTGDRIFPVLWTQETDSATVNVHDVIFTVQEISV